MYIVYVKSDILTNCCLEPMWSIYQERTVLSDKQVP